MSDFLSRLAAEDERRQSNPFSSRLAAEEARRLGNSTPGQAFGRAATTTFADNLMGIPNAVLNAARYAVAGPEKPDALKPKTVSGLPGPLEALQMASEALRPKSLGDRVIPMPSGEQVVAGGLSLAGPRTYQEEMARGQQMRSTNPTASVVGDVAGDVATIFTGRLPFVGSIQKAEKTMAALPLKNLPPGFRRQIDNVLKSDAMKSLYRGTGRAVETGLEGAALSILKGGDPMEAAAYSAGAQAAGSGILAVTKYGLSGGPTAIGMKLGAAALAAGSLLQVSKELTPMGQGNIFDVVQSMDEGFSKVAFGLVLGAVSGAAGFGRVRGENLPKISDALTAIPRAGVISLITDALKEEQAGGSNVRQTLTHMGTNPDAFNATQQKRLERSITEGTFAKTVNEMVEKDPRFRAVIDSDPSDIAAKLEEEQRKREIRKRLNSKPE